MAHTVVPQSALNYINWHKRRIKLTNQRSDHKSTPPNIQLRNRVLRAIKDQSGKYIDLQGDRGHYIRNRLGRREWNPDVNSKYNIATWHDGATPITDQIGDAVDRVIPYAKTPTAPLPLRTMPAKLQMDAWANTHQTPLDHEQIEQYLQDYEDYARFILPKVSYRDELPEVYNKIAAKYDGTYHANPGWEHGFGLPEWLIQLKDFYTFLPVAVNITNKQTDSILETLDLFRDEIQSNIGELIQSVSSLAPNHPLVQQITTNAYPL